MLPNILTFQDNDRDISHKYLQFSNEVIKGVVPMVTLLLLRYFVRGRNITDKQWKNDRDLITINWHRDARNFVSKPFNYRVFLDHLKSKRAFYADDFELFGVTEDFLDVATSFASASHGIANDGSPAMQLNTVKHRDFLGESYPIAPILCSEGFLVGAFLDVVIRRVIDLRAQLVNTSQSVFTFEWFFKLRDIINDSIAGLDIMLNLIYIKAEFDPKADWKFEREKLGSRFGKRFRDKLAWVQKISGKELNIEKYQKSLFFMQELRNHLNHFDPPSFCLTLQECKTILNAVLDIGLIHLEIRKVLGLNPSQTLIRLVLQPLVEFVPEPKYAQRVDPQRMADGYRSCRWPEA